MNVKGFKHNKYPFNWMGKYFHRKIIKELKDNNLWDKFNLFMIKGFWIKK